MNKLIHGNCWVEMLTMDTGSVDLVVTSPPYDDLRNYDGYSFNFEYTAVQLIRLLKQGGVIVWVVSDQTKNGTESGTSFKQALHFMELGLSLHDTMIYKRWSGPMNHNRYEQEFEYMFVFSKGKPKTFTPIMVPCKTYGTETDRTGQNYPEHNEIKKKFRTGKDRGNILASRIDGNVWEMKNSSQAGEKYGHPAPFPEELAYRHIISWSNPGDIVLDPFAGSGTTPKMAIETGRDYIAIESNKDYYEIAQKRIAGAQPALFA